MIVVAALVQLASVSSFPAPSQEPDIVINARTTAEAKRALDACVASRCPPPGEIKAALVYATRKLVDGDYAGARNVLLDTRRRTGRFEKDYPVDVSDLHRALNRLSNLDGRQDSARISAVDATDALRAGLRPDDPEILKQRLFSGNQLAREGRIFGASAIYNDVAAKARKREIYAVEAQALFHGAALYLTLASVDPIYRQAARKWVKRISARTEPEFIAMRDDVGVLQTAIAALAVDPDKRSAIYDRVPPISRAEAILLREPPMSILQSGLELAGKHGGSGIPEWADVGFWVRPDGSVGDLQIIRQSDSRPGSWLSDKVRAVAGRRYVKLQRPPYDRGIYRVERYSIVHNFLPVSGTRVPTRSSEGQIDTMDLTPLHRSSAN